MSEKRYQVFVSSTFKDLEVERQEVMHALLELDCIPAGMELFPAADETQWNLIKRVIDDCDYYILILAGRYGSIGPDGLSYTEMEFQYALDTKKPVIAFTHRAPGKISADNSESSDEGKAKLAAFRKLAEERLCKQWETAQELGSVVSRSLIQLIKSTPAIGWVRANELADKEATLELLQLRRRVDELKKEIASLQVSAPEGTDELAQGDDRHEFSFFVMASEFSYQPQQAVETTCSFSWNEIFFAIAPYLIIEASEDDILNALNSYAFGHVQKKFYEDEENSQYDVNKVSIQHHDFQTIKVQFRSLGLIEESERSRGSKQSGTFWSLTPYGDKTMSRLRAIKRPNGVFA